MKNWSIFKRNFVKPVDRESRKNPKLALCILGLLVLIFTAAISAAIGAITALLAPVEPPIISRVLDATGFNYTSNRSGYRLSRPVNILILGIDRVPKAAANSRNIFNGRSDTILLFHLDPRDKSISLLSIPRDTKVEIPGIRFSKINEANARGGAVLAARLVSTIANNATIERYVRVSSGAFRELVDLLDGVEVFVPRAMSYTDRAQKLSINLAQGWQTLNGEQAEQLARFRNDGLGDIGRIQRQQSLIQAIRNRLASPSVLVRLPQIVRLMQKYVDTNLNFEEILTIANFGLQLERDNFKMVMLPGRSSSSQGDLRSYWILDAAGRDRIMTQYFKQGAADFAQERIRNPSQPVSPANLKIAVQNASSNPKTAKTVASFLRKKGFDNVSVVKDWPDKQRQSQIIVQQGDLEAANLLQKAIGDGKIEASSTGEIESDLTLRVGEDWIKRF
ncbi:MAG: LCP family protein [Microcoleus sp. PH2017_10_PVI_O_A]|uniref:LCP family protein n=1 Tax=unclassified Microcoleus TaxID=2642155 RepID=UPI001D75EBF6|nr:MULTISPECIES: LCP family protein [unclassified Microcoleus]TAE86620.1 MAG: LytR family transcriptional regulator [Oscillatoriales cyanobacterium]MCC3410015.1 LCP family protein [Microcoleus sp. PH2017_10_PVI_O_A]MCC3464272.1 LCP family protein [Microcoleus sp. PH2017_11_PCY_U_A]MCC3482624.1 LCP family protein [Microcoleus sp. PH2017_12_PCY_D_A]MCC3563611.1 LCP family protein [Microcoleus sp. PH2017_27_LUM_O_A]